MDFPIRIWKLWELIDPISYPKTWLPGFTSLTLSREMGPLICRVPSIESCVSKSVSVCDSLRFDENERSRNLSQNDDKNQNLARIRWEHGNQASLSLMGSLRQAMLALTVMFLIDQRVITCHMSLPDSKFATNYRLQTDWNKKCISPTSPTCKCF